ncbi:hypothetical protein HK102_011719, partial [Quaeritorhiza haematococci]
MDKLEKLESEITRVEGSIPDLKRREADMKADMVVSHGRCEGYKKRIPELERALKVQIEGEARVKALVESETQAVENMKTRYEGLVEETKRRKERAVELVTEQLRNVPAREMWEQGAQFVGELYHDQAPFVDNMRAELEVLTEAVEGLKADVEASERISKQLAMLYEKWSVMLEQKLGEPARHTAIINKAIGSYVERLQIDTQRKNLENDLHAKYDAVEIDRLPPEWDNPDDECWTQDLSLDVCWYTVDTKTRIFSSGAANARIGKTRTR